MILFLKPDNQIKVKSRGMLSNTGFFFFLTCMLQRYVLLFNLNSFITVMKGLIAVPYCYHDKDFCCLRNNMYNQGIEEINIFILNLL